MEFDSRALCIQPKIPENISTINCKGNSGENFLKHLGDLLTENSGKRMQFQSLQEISVKAEIVRGFNFH